MSNLIRLRQQQQLAQYRARLAFDTQELTSNPILISDADRLAIEDAMTNIHPGAVFVNRVGDFSELVIPKDPLRWHSWALFWFSCAFAAWRLLA